MHHKVGKGDEKVERTGLGKKKSKGRASKLYNDLVPKNNEEAKKKNTTKSARGTKKRGEKKKVKRFQRATKKSLKFNSD